MIKCGVVLLLLVSAANARGTPNVGSLPDPSGTNGGENSKEDLILLLLGQIKNDVTELKTDMTAVKADVSELKVGQSSLDTTVGGLVIEVSDLKSRANEQSWRINKLESDSEALNVEMADLSNIEENDFTSLDTKLSNLETTVEDNYNELKGAIDVSPYCYHYSVSPSAGDWEEGRAYCQNIGGSLAYHGFDSIDYREEVLCGKLDICDDSCYDYLWFGLRKINGSWYYMDSTLVSDEDNFWYNSQQPTDTSAPCADIRACHGSDDVHLKVWSDSCTAHQYQAICEIPC